MSARWERRRTTATNRLDLQIISPLYSSLIALTAVSFLINLATVCQLWGWRAQTLRSRPDAQFRFAGSVMRVARWAAGSQQVSAGFTDGGGSRGRCVSGRGGSRDHSPLPCALSFQTWPSDLNYIFMSASLSRWNRSVSAVFSGDAPGSSNFVSFHVLAPESLDSSCLKASKERGPCSVFEMGWHRFPSL